MSLVKKQTCVLFDFCTVKMKWRDEVRFSHVNLSTTQHLTEFDVSCVCAEEILEQADYLYSCAETEKLYQLLLQYKDR